MVLTETIMNSLVGKIGEKLADLFTANRKETQIVKIAFNPMSFHTSELDDVTTTKKDFPDNLEANLEIKNPVKRDIVVKEITLLPDDNFKKNGIAQIFINNVRSFRSKKVGNFKNVQVLDIKIAEGKLLKRDESIKIFIKNDDDVTPINLTIQVTFGEV